MRPRALLSHACASTALMALLLVPTAGAHPYHYTNAAGDDVVICNAPQVGNLGGVCMSSADLLGAAAGTSVVVTIVDDVTNPTSGFACVDRNFDNQCDADVGGKFCDQIALAKSLVQQVNQVTVFLDSAVFGNPALGACPNAASSAGTTGNVVHD